MGRGDGVVKIYSTNKVFTSPLLASALWSVVLIIFSNAIFSYFVFQHDFGGGVPIEQGAEGYFDFLKSTGSLAELLVFNTVVSFFILAMLFFLLLRKR